MNKVELENRAKHLRERLTEERKISDDLKAEIAELKKYRMDYFDAYNIKERLRGENDALKEVLNRLLPEQADDD